MELDELKMLADQGDLEAMVSLGNYYGAQKNYIKADEWYEKSYKGSKVHIRGLFYSILTKKILLWACEEITNGLMNNVYRDLCDYSQAAALAQQYKNNYSSDEYLEVQKFICRVLYYLGIAHLQKNNREYCQMALDNFKSLTKPGMETLISDVEIIRANLGLYLAEVLLARYDSNTDKCITGSKQLYKHLKIQCMPLLEGDHKPAEERLIMMAATTASEYIGKEVLSFVKPYIQYEYNADELNSKINAPEKPKGVNMKTCPKCQFANDADSKFCMKCGQALAVQKTEFQSNIKFCVYCGASLIQNAKFCMKCGKAVVTDSNYIDEAEFLLQTAYYYREGEGLNENKDFSIALYKKVLAKDANNVRALYGLSWCFHDDEDESINIDTWLPLIQKAAELGHANSQVVLAEHYANNVEDDASLASYKNAIYWYEKAIEQDNTDALGALAWIILSCRDSSLQDLKKALSYLEKGYSLDPDTFASDLGQAYYLVENDEVKDYKKSMLYCKEAALKGDWDAARRIGNMYEKGQGVEKDLYNAFAWFKSAAEHGDRNGLTCIANMVTLKEEYPIIVESDEAIKYLEKASNEISCIYIADLMRIYEKGKYGTVDYKKADYYCNKFTETIREKPEKGLNPDLARSLLTTLRQRRALDYATAITKWTLAADNNVDEKKEVIKLFEKNIEDNADLWSLKTLIYLLMGEKGMHRLDNCAYIIENVKDPEINSIPEVVDIKKAFELIDKGIAWGDKECKDILNHYCTKASNLLC